jgi:hypothetical protein
MNSFFDKFDKFFKPDQTSDLEFRFFCSFNLSAIDWLKETTHEHTCEDIDGEIFITFKEAQGAVEFKLRFI